MGAEDCIFCKIADGRIATNYIHEDDICVAFADLSPQAPTHILIVPRKHIDSLAEATPDDNSTLGHLLGAAAEIARGRGFEDAGYRVVINTNSDGGQPFFTYTFTFWRAANLSFPRAKPQISKAL